MSQISVPQFGLLGLETKQETKLFDILEQCHPTHFDRLWLAGYLLNRFGKDVALVWELVDRYNKWEDYNPSATYVQIKSVLRSMGRSGHGLGETFNNFVHMSFDNALALFEEAYNKAEAISEPK